MKTLICALCGLVCILLFHEETNGQRRSRRVPTPQQRTTQQDSQGKSPPALPVLPDIRNDPDVAAADVALIANITIKELRFDTVPNPTVEFLGKDKTKTVWHTDRFNLPDQVQPGVTYRNVGLRLKIISRLADIDRIVSEALGEIPVSSQVEKQAVPQVEKDSPQRQQASQASPTTASKRGPNE